MGSPAPENEPGTKDATDKVANTVQGTIDTAGGIAEGATGAGGDETARDADETVKGAEDQAEEPGEKAPSRSLSSPSIRVKVVDMFEGPPLCPMIAKSRTRMATPPPPRKLTESQDSFGKEIKAINEKGVLLGEDNAVLHQADLAPEGTVRVAAQQVNAEMCDLAGLLEKFMGTVTKAIEIAKRQLEDIQYAKKELNSLSGLAQPCFQIIAAVGLLLSGVLGLFGKLLNARGLGGSVNVVLGGLGLNKILDGLDLGSVVGAITMQDNKKGGGKKYVSHSNHSFILNKYRPMDCKHTVQGLLRWRISNLPNSLEIPIILFTIVRRS
ncbi:late embryogenesis abundant protein [Apiospora marii]|uniref:Late embryogenesis abundant protein n=1 Tax=Apiospora marii TaxID=335849 RepID=A0ABR1RJK4_9PEZI